MKPHRVLIVDDHEESAYFLRALMQGHGWEVSEAAHGREAIEKGRQHPPDLVISDILMPVMDGFTLCKEWMKDARLRSIPFIFYTATYTDERDRDFAMSIGASEFLVKPGEPEALMRAIIDTIARFQAQGDARQASSPLDEEQEEVVFLKQYNEALVRKLEDKTEQLEQINRRLEQDIAERRKIENELRETEERFRLIAETIDEVFWIFDVENWKMTYLSPAHDRIWGYPRELVLQNSSCLLKSIPPEDRQQVEDSLAQMKLGRPHENEHRIILPDGSTKHLWNRGFPIFDKSGKATRYVGISQDVTAWRRDKEALRQSTEYLNRIINCIGDPLFVKDRRHRYVLVNDAFCAFNGLKREETLGRCAPQNVERTVWEQEEAILEKGGESVDEENASDGRGASRTMMAKKTLLIDDNGNRQIVGVLRDITEYRRLQLQFAQSQKMEAIGVLAGGVAHDFNNLLTVIKGYTELLMEELDPNDPRRADLDQIIKAGQQATSLTTQLLAFSRKQVLQPEMLNLNDILDEVGKMLRRLIGEDVKFAVVTQPDLGQIYVDPVQVQQVLMNLAVNARDAMPQGGNLTIETANVFLDDRYARAHDGSAVKSGDYVMLAVSDNGLGMDATTRARIFEPFFTTKGKGKGTGLGLSTVYGIVNQSNGYIWVYSEPGKGTTFKVYFPRATKDAAEPRNEPTRTPQYRGAETVLLVEDETPVRNLASRILRDRGYTVLEAAQGTDAINVARQFSGPIDLILTDIIMPGMSGKDLVTQIEGTRPGIKTLYVSGYTDEVIVHHGILDSNTDFLQKPYSVESLTHKVWEVLNR